MPALLAWFVTQLFVLLGWILFRVGSFQQLALHLQNAPCPIWLFDGLRTLLVLGPALLILDYLQVRAGSDEAWPQRTAWGRAMNVAVMLLLILLFWERNTTPFIYFQF